MPTEGFEVQFGRFDYSGGYFSGAAGRGWDREGQNAPNPALKQRGKGV